MPSKAGSWRQRARNEAVAAVLARGLPEPDRARAKGRGGEDSEPPTQGVAAKSQVLILSLVTHLLQPPSASAIFPHSRINSLAEHAVAQVKPQRVH